jgi:Zn-dependent protease
VSGRTTQHAPERGTTVGRRPPRGAGGEAPHSLRIGRLFGIPLQVHWSFPLLLALVVLAEWPAGAGAVVGGLVWVAALFACVVAHELAHCLLARRRGGTVLGILLLPIGGMSRMDALPSSPGDEAAIAAVGPATSLALGGVLLVVGALVGNSIWPPTLLAGSWWARLGWLNLLLGVFNLLPALPMDGGRVLRAGLARHLPRLVATRIAVTVARVLALALVIVGLFYDFWFVVIGVFVFLGASREEAIARAEELAKQRPPASAWWHGWPPPGGRAGQGGWDTRAGPPGAWGYQPAGQQPGAWGQQQGGWAPPSGGWYPPGPGSGTWYSPPRPGGTPSDRDWPPPWGQQPSPRSAIDVAVERRGPDAGGGETLGEGVGEHD